MTLYNLNELEDPIATTIRVDDRGIMILWNVSKLPQDYMTSHLRRQQFSRIRIILIDFSESNGLYGNISSHSWAWWHYVPQIFWWSGETDHLPLFAVLWLNLQAQYNNNYQWNICVLGVGQLFWYNSKKCMKWVHKVEWWSTGSISRTTLCLSNKFETINIQTYFLKISHSQHIRNDKTGNMFQLIK